MKIIAIRKAVSEGLCLALLFVAYSLTVWMETDYVYEERLEGGFGISEPEIRADSYDGASTSVEGKIELKSVHFKYARRQDVPVLKNGSFTVGPGQTVAIVATSGSGKSTIVQLLLRFCDPVSGQVLLNHQDHAIKFGTDEINMDKMACLQQRIKFLEETIVPKKVRNFETGTPFENVYSEEIRKIFKQEG